MEKMKLTLLNPDLENTPFDLKATIKNVEIALKEELYMVGAWDVLGYATATEFVQDYYYAVVDRLAEYFKTIQKDNGTVILMTDVYSPTEGKLDASYMGYTGSYTYETEEVGDPFYHGKVLGIADVITYEAATIELLNTEFKQSIIDYIDFCKELNKEPLKPLSYKELLTEFTPFIITNEEQLDMVQWRVDKLIDRGRLTTDEDQYLALLLLTVEAYEDIYHPTPKYDDYLFEYVIRGGNTLLLRVKAESRKEAVNIFFENVAWCFYDKDSGIGSVTLVRVIHLDKVKQAALKKLDNS